MEIFSNEIKERNQASMKRETEKLGKNMKVLEEEKRLEKYWKLQ